MHKLTDKDLCGGCAENKKSTMAYRPVVERISAAVATAAGRYLANRIMSSSRYRGLHDPRPVRNVNAIGVRRMRVTGRRAGIASVRQTRMARAPSGYTARSYVGRSTFRRWDHKKRRRYGRRKKYRRKKVRWNRRGWHTGHSMIRWGPKGAGGHNYLHTFKYFDK